jgi:hypothetical protein
VPDREILQHLLEPPRPHRASMSLPLVTFLMPTFGRAARQPHLLSEAVYWVTRQAYPNWELLIVNDAPGQTLVTDTPGVRILNWPRKLKSLGEKMNLGVNLAAGSIILPCEDDDVSLPWRAKQAVEALNEYDYWQPGLWWYEEAAACRAVADGKGVGHNCSAYRRSSFMGRYQPITKGHDAAARAYAEAYLRCNPNPVAGPAEISYVYRWGVSDFHLSGRPDMEAAYAAADPGPAGTYPVIPAAGKDYVALHADWAGVENVAQ